ncbi:MAG: hypothetical protein APF80_11790 [Alphaproteobacteria bacterium BRH_c36]|nr:MAG: hypothetical protein APF80_11790 [Alphaproteobacteria bacterium BRH_c36]
MTDSSHSSANRAAATFLAILTAVVMTVSAARLPASAQELDDQRVDTALILAVDTSRSVNDERFRLQMDGIAQALEDQGVIDAILGGPRGAIVIQLVAWADGSDRLLPWTLVRSRAEALMVAARIRRLPRISGEYTCMARMLRKLSETVLPNVPYSPLKTVIDVSGDGIDNCESVDQLDAARTEAIGLGAVINGLPVIVDKDQLVGEGAYRAPGAGLVLLTPPGQRQRTTLDKWFEDHVIGGFGAFIVPANGYRDFARAMRSKFVVEISSVRQRPIIAPAPLALSEFPKDLR